MKKQPKKYSPVPSPTDGEGRWWLEALKNSHLSPQEHIELAQIDREHARLKRVCKGISSAQRCGYDRPGNLVPRFRNDNEKPAWWHRRNAARKRGEAA